MIRADPRKGQALGNEADGFKSIRNSETSTGTASVKHTFGPDAGVVYFPFLVALCERQGHVEKSGPEWKGRRVRETRCTVMAHVKSRSRDTSYVCRQSCLMFRAQKDGSEQMRRGAQQK